MLFLFYVFFVYQEEEQIEHICLGFKISKGLFFLEMCFWFLVFINIFPLNIKITKNKILQNLSSGEVLFDMFFSCLYVLLYFIMSLRLSLQISQCVFLFLIEFWY